MFWTPLLLLLPLQYAAAKGSKTVDDIIEEIAVGRGEMAHSSPEDWGDIQGAAADLASVGAISSDRATCCEGSANGSVGSSCSGSADGVVSTVLMPSVAGPGSRVGSGTTKDGAAASTGRSWWR